MDPRPIYKHLLAVRDRKGAGFLVLIDPDKLPFEALPPFIDRCGEAGVDALLVGGSLMHATDFDRYVEAVRQRTSLPVIGFPGTLAQVSRSLDAILYLSVLTSRNPEFIFGQHVQAAPMLRAMRLEPISTGYMLFDAGRVTTAAYMTDSRPLPREKPEIAAATALAAEMLGMQLLFADAGSGARHSIPVDVIAAMREVCSKPLLIGGGLRTPQAVAERVEAGADFIVVGNAFERRADPEHMAELAAAAHIGLPQALEG